jgi:DNA-binding GntR family transcriptional regulator
MGGMSRAAELPSARVEADLRRRLAEGEWEPGEALPSVGKLAASYGVARNTILKALRRLSDDGLVQVVPHWGTFRVGGPQA